MSVNNNYTCKQVLTPKIGDSVKALIFVHTNVSSVDLSNYYNKQETDDLLAKKLATEDLDDAIDQALLEAKESGEFKGEQGEQGIPGIDGKDGRTPIKGEDYFTEEDKAEFVEDITPTIKDKVEEIIGDVGLDGNASSIVYTSSMAETHDVTNVKDALDKLLNKVYYVALSLSSSSGGGTYEKGSTQNITITATFNKVPDRITIKGESIIPSQTITKTYSGVKSNETYSLIAYSENAEGQTINVSKTFYATFVNKKYYGVSSKTTLTSAEINSLTGVLDADRKGDFTVNAGSGQYIFFAIPSAYGTPAFKVGGFDGGFDKVDTISHTNKSGYIENYDVYKSTNASLGSTTVTVN